MASQQSSQADHGILVIEPVPEHQTTASHDVTTLISQPEFSNLNKPIIVQIRPITTSSSKLKSLLPKNAVNVIPISEPAPNSSQVSSMSQGPLGSKLSNVIPSEIIISQTSDDKINQNNTYSLSNSTGIIENILQHLQSNLVSTGNNESEVKVPQSGVGQDHDKTIPLTVEAAHVIVPEYVVTPQLSGGDLHHSSGLTTSALLATPDETDKEQDVIKKTMVEAFVKMVVCRKVTVQKVHAKTGQILDTKVKMEEEEPVVLGVDCVETTEDLISSTSDLGISNSCTTDPVSSKWGTSLDGGLKFLSAVSESRQKIGKSIKKESTFRPSPQKGVSLSNITEIEASNTNQILASSEKLVDSISIRESQQIKSEPKSDSDSDWNEDLNDDSEDYIPGTSRPTISVRNHNVRKAHAHNQKDQFGDRNNQPDLKDDSVLILCQKKRGRKRKWDNALGMASNLRTCQFCNKHFKNVQACAKHMKKGSCISSVFCFICSRPFRNEQELEGHLVTHGTEMKSGAFECADCNRSYRTRAGYVKHFRMGTCSKRDDFEDGYTGEYKCNLCESRFSSEGYLKLHRYKVHENPRDTHTCSDCGKRFYSSQGFNKHRQGRPCTEPLRCHICGKTYSSKAKESFKIHMKHHRTEVSGVTFQCDECDRSYMTEMALNKHKLSHMGVKPYKCDVCGKEFSMRYMVKDHARMHTGDRPFLCVLCGSAFSNKGHLGRHIRSHENGTLLKRGRPKKIKGHDDGIGQETELKMIEFKQTLHNFDGQTIQVVDGQMFESQAHGTPMIIQANNNTIIIAEGWPNGSSSASTITLPNAQSIENVTAHSSN